MKFGRLTVIKEVGRDKNKKYQWLCRCDCGNEKVVIGDHLKDGHTTSCGCYAKERASQANSGKTNSNNLVGEIFGKLTVIKREGKNKDNRALWTCKCECGNKVTVSTEALKRYKTSCGQCENPVCNECGTDVDVYNSNKFGRFLCKKCWGKENNKTKPKKFPKSKGGGYRKSIDNEITICTDYADMCLYDKQGSVVSHTKIDVSDIDKVKGYRWTTIKPSKGKFIYVVSKTEKDQILLHRFIMDCPNGKLVDHINHDTLDNRKYNLRVCTKQQNEFNKKAPLNNASGIIGVSFDKKAKKWEAYITLNKHRKSLGRFKNKNDAVEARRMAEEKYFGEYRYGGVS